MREKTIALLGIMLLLSAIPSLGCDIAVVSSKASATGRPFLWKNRDYSGNWKQEIVYSQPEDNLKGTLKVVDNTLFPIKSLTSGGINDSGFAIVNSTCYQPSPIHEYISNANLDLLSSALETCKTVNDFDKLVAGWNENKKNRFMILSGNFAVMDAKGSVALFELSTGTGFYSYGARVMLNRIDVNTGFVTNEDGQLIGNNGEIGFITDFQNNSIREIINGLREITDNEFSISENCEFIVDANGNIIDDGSNYCGFINRANSNFWVHLKDDVKRMERATLLLKDLAAENSLTYRKVLQNVARDIDISDANDLEDVSTIDSISRYCTNFAMVIDGVKKSEDSSLSTMWVNLGEPSCGIATPYFIKSAKVPFYAWADAYYYFLGPLDTGASSLLNKKINETELSVYSNNISEGNLPCPPDQLNNYYLTNILNLDLNENYVELWNNFEEILSDWHTEYARFVKEYDTMDKTINYEKLLSIQANTISVEDTIIKNTELFLDKYRNGDAQPDEQKFYDFSKYCAGYAYKNFNKKYSSKFKW